VWQKKCRKVCRRSNLFYYGLDFGLRIIQENTNLNEDERARILVGARRNLVVEVLAGMKNIRVDDP
jgi:hypothetical protein